MHISQVENRRLNHPSNDLKECQDLKLKLLGFDDRDRVRLSMTAVHQVTGKEITKDKKAEG